MAGRAPAGDLMEGSRARRRLDALRGEGQGGAGPFDARPAPARPGPASRAPADPRFPGWTREGEFLYRRRQYFEGRGISPWPAPFSPEADDPDDFVFYDTETTGLSGGAGSVIFLFGAAWNEGRDLAVEQLFLSDFPGEPEFLLAVQDLFSRFRAFVSYNGKTFDSHLLRSRFLMNRIAWEPGPQVDILHHARRLWRTISGDCSLRAIEARILGFVRDGDIAGEDIPLVWLEFLRSGRPGALPVVFDHNVLDIVSTARLHGVIGRILEGDLDAAPVDEGALGRWLLREAPSAGAAVLEGAWTRGNAEAGLSLGLHHKRRREFEKAAAIWESVLRGARSMTAAVELAKHLEHRVRDHEAALRAVEAVLSWGLPLSTREREQLRLRRERLRRKLDARRP